VIPSLAPEFSAGHRAALTSGNPLLYVCPPASWGVGPLFAQMGRGTGLTLVLAPAEGLTDDVGMTLGTLPEQRVVVAGGLARTARLLKSIEHPTVVATPGAALGLAGRSLLAAGTLSRIVVLWPELLNATDRRAANAVLADHQAAQRVLVTSDPDGAADFVERYAPRAPILNAVSAPAEPLGPARVTIVGARRLHDAVSGALDALDPSSTILWDPMGTDRWARYRDDPTVRLAEDAASGKATLAIATDLPTPDVFEALSGLAAEVWILARPWQQAYLRRIAEPIKSVRLVVEVDRARDRAAALRRAIEQQLHTGDQVEGLLALAPLFDRYDAAAIAAAALHATAGTTSTTDGEEDLPTWVHLRVDSGRRQGLRPSDLVGALLNAAGIPRDHVGRVDLHDTFALIQIRTPSVKQAISGLEATNLRGRSVKVTLDLR